MFKDALIRFGRIVFAGAVVYAAQAVLAGGNLPALDLGRAVLTAAFTGAIHAATEYLRTWLGSQPTPIPQSRPRAGALKVRFRTWGDNLPI